MARVGRQPLRARASRSCTTILRAVTRHGPERRRDDRGRAPRSSWPIRPTTSGARRRRTTASTARVASFRYRAPGRAGARSALAAAILRACSTSASPSASRPRRRSASAWRSRRRACRARRLRRRAPRSTSNSRTGVLLRARRRPRLVARRRRTGAAGSLGRHRLARQPRRRRRERWLGRAPGTLLRWNRAKNDVDKTGKVIARQVGEPADEFVPGRRLDGFDAFYSRRAKQKLVVPDHTFGPGDKIADRRRTGKVYVLDGRGGGADGDGGRGDRAVLSGRSTHGGTRRRATRGAPLIRG